MKLAIIIGGSSGIGYATAKLLSSEYRVVNLSRHEASGIDSITTDVTDYSSIQNSFSLLIKNYGIPDIMIYCAGFADPKSIFEISKDSLEKTIATNLTGAFYCTLEFVKCSNRREGKIIYIASTAGMRAQPGWSAYAASKAGLINFALTMASELKNFNIKVYCIAPGRCATPLRKILAPNEDQSKLMQPEEVAAFVKYLADDGKFLNDQVIIIKQDNMNL